jgi:hypothetical protein
LLLFLLLLRTVAVRPLRGASNRKATGSAGGYLQGGQPSALIAVRGPQSFRLGFRWIIQNSFQINGRGGAGSGSPLNA